MYLPLIHIHGSEVMDHTHILHSLTSLQTTVQSKHITQMGRGSWRNVIMKCMQVHVSTMAWSYTEFYMSTYKVW